MDKTVEHYQCSVKKLLSEYALSSPPWAKTELFFDDERMGYVVMRVGWYKNKRVHRCLIHIDIIDGKIVIQENNTEDLLKTELIEMGVPAEKIELGFIPAKAWTFAQPIDKTLVLEPA